MRALFLLAALLLLLSGCGANFETEERSLQVRGTSRTLKGVELLVDFQWHRHAAGDVEVHAIASASNAGTTRYKVETQCGDPWRFWFEENGTRLEHRAPEGRCEAFITKPFAPGDRLGERLDWPRTLWNATSGRIERAPEGLYGIFVAFSFYAESGGMDSIALSYPFELPP